MARIAKYSNQKFDINTRNIHKGIFSCNLWWFAGVCNIAVEAYCLATGRIGVVFLYPLFVYSCPTSLVKNMIFLAPGKIY